MNLLRRIAAVAALAVPLAFATGVSAQETGTITGQVTDAADGRPLAGVQMVLAGTNLGTLTNANGRYIITRAPLGAQTVRAVLIGYSQSTQQVNVTAGQPVVADFQLTTSAVNLEAIVVSAATGREQRLREIGTSVGTIEVEDINPAAVTSVADVLGGRTEGVIMQDLNGTTGTSQRIRIRGANSLSLSNEPLIFIDGVQANASTGGLGLGGQEPSRLNDINPNDIANIEIIKGPAASAQYGTAAANGVILITTKRGAPGQTNWEFFAETGQIDDITDYPAIYAAYDEVDGSTDDLFTDRGFLNPARASFCSNINAALGNCSQDGTLVYNTLEDPRTRLFDTGNRQRLGASVRGGNESVRYFVSGQWEDERGTVFFNTQEKVNIRTNLDAALRDNLDLSVSVGYTDGVLSLNNNDNSVFSPIIQGLLGYPNAITKADTDDYAGPARENYGFGLNLQDLSEDITWQETDRFVASGNFRFRPTNWLSFNVNGGVDLASNHDFETVQPGGTGWGSFSFVNGFRQSWRRRAVNYTGIASGTGTFALTNDLQSTTTVGTQYTDRTTESTYCFGAGLTPGTANCAATTLIPDIDETFFQVTTLGIYAQQEFAFQDRLFLTGGIRGDKSSTFGRNLGFQYFPSASLSYVISDEAFFPEIEVFDSNLISTLRLRGAWGRAGLQPGFRDAVTLFQPTTVAVDGTDAPGVALDETGNDLLKQETSEEFELGFQAGLFDERLSVDFTYYDRTSSDALINVPLAPSLGLTGTVLDNVGSIANWGTELGIRADIVQTETFGLNVGFNNTTINNEIQELGRDDPIIFNRGLQRHAEGFPAGAFFNPDVTWNDANNDGLLVPTEVEIGDEAVFIGPAIPTWQRSVFADVRLFDFITISTLFEGRGGHFTGNDSEAFRCGVLDGGGYGCGAVGDPNEPLWQQAAYIADNVGVPSTDANGNPVTLFSKTGTVEPADFWRWRELTVAFDIPQSVSSRVPALDGLRVTLSGRNLALFTDYTGLDPETVEGGGSANFSQSEFNTQPPVRLLLLRLDYTF